jgi:uncharacterized membrane protein YdfJ with MMPL/SSD domain
MATIENPDQDFRGPTRDDDERWSGFQQALSVLRRRIQGNGASDLVLAELLEDDLRQARVALHAVSDFLDDTLETLGAPSSSPAAIINASDTTAALEAVDQLAELMPSLRRRLGQVALRLTRR